MCQSIIIYSNFSSIQTKHTKCICFSEERNQTQVLRQQQDEAYLASLRADQEKERKKREEQEQRRQEEEKVRQSALAEERRRRVSFVLHTLYQSIHRGLINTPQMMINPFLIYISRHLKKRRRGSQNVFLQSHLQMILKVSK